MLRRKQKGQSLVEFALILPILLMLVLGIIEGGRIIWAYITVQNAAREAARYAVTGRPFACGADPIDYSDASEPPGDDTNPEHFCDDSTMGDPWSPQVDASARVVAIKNVAIEYSKNLNVSLWATGDLSDFNMHKPNPGTNFPGTPGAFGIAVIGQDGANPSGLPNYGGQPGYNVRVEAYYNVEMIDPIYDVIMGQQPIHLSGQVELQNEGTDPNSIGYQGGITFQSDSCAPNCGSSAVPYITVQDENGDRAEPQGGNFTVAVNDHQANTAYTVWFVHETNATHSYSLDFVTDNLGSRLLNYVISASALPTTGAQEYKIYTTLRGSSAPVASCLGDLPVNAPCFEVTAGASTIEARNITQGDQQQQPVEQATWPISSSIPIYLFGHDVNTTYIIKFNGQTSSSAPGGMLFDGASSDTIPTDSQFGTNFDNIPGYYIATNHSEGDMLISSENLSSLEVASTTVELVEASIAIAGEEPDTLHPADDILWITLLDHARLQQYQVVFEDGLTPPTVVRANDRGQLAFNYVVPLGIQEPCANTPEPGCQPIPVEIHTLDHNRGTNPNKIARRTINVFTPIDPYINVPGGSRWPAGSPITIQLRRHTPNTQYRVYLEEQGTGFRELINGSAITTDGSGAYNMSYQIPASYGGFYVIRSYVWDGTTEAADPTAGFDMEVTTEPYVSIDDGNRWPPGADITIRLGNHVPSLPYEVWLDKDGPNEMFLGEITMNAFGGELIEFTIPPDIPTPDSPTYYTIRSYFDGEIVAETRLEVNPADLRVVSIDLPTDVTFDVEIPITVTIANDEPVAINETYFDADIYLDPSPDPTISDQGLPPGDYKTWIRNMPATGTVQIYEDIVLFGQENHEIHARADTTNWVVESDENNNLLSRLIEAACQVEIEDNFQNGSLPGWTQTEYGDNNSSSQSVSGGTLTLRNDGTGVTASNDHNDGYHLMHHPVTGPFEVYIRVNQGPNSWRGLAGLEIRSDHNDGGANKVMIGRRGNNTLGAYKRVDSGTSNLGGVNINSDPVWLKIVRNGDEFELYYEVSTSTTPPTDWGNPWQTVSGVTMPDTVQVGIFNAPGSTWNYTATFRSYHVCATEGLVTRCGQVEENGNGLVVVDAANYVINQAVGGDSWQEVEVPNALGRPVMLSIQALPDNGDDVGVGAGPHATYQVNFESSGTFYMWVAGRGVDGNGNSVHVGMNGANVGTVTNLPNPAGWVSVGSTSVSAGINTIDLWMAEDGAQILKILLTQSDTYVPDPNGVSQSACTVIAEPHVPPLLEVCSDPIELGGFESLYVQNVEAAWTPTGLAGVFSPVSYSGLRSTVFPTDVFREPTIRQAFEMPALEPVGILSNTTAYLRLNKAVDLNGASNPGDHLYFALRRPADGQDVIPQILLADGQDRTGDVPPIPDLDPATNLAEDWTEYGEDIFAVAGVNPLSIVEAGDALEVVFYAPPTASALSTAFYLDNVSLEFCSVQSAPDQEAGLGRITGRTLRSGAPLPGVTVWAYADAADDGTPGPVFQTMSIQDGSYRFYNLPAGQYLIYAEVTTTDGTFAATQRIQVYAGQETRNVILNVQFATGN